MPKRYSIADQEKTDLAALDISPEVFADVRDRSAGREGQLRRPISHKRTAIETYLNEVISQSLPILPTMKPPPAGTLLSARA